MSASSSIHQLDPSMTAPWTRPAPLPDVPGGEANLLPRSAWADPDNPLRVKFKPWYDLPIGEGGSESVWVFLGNNESNVIGSRTWTLPMDADDHYVEISADKLPQGEHRISFIMENFQGVKARSFPYTVTIDKQEPLLNTISDLIFPPDVLPPKAITADYLDAQTPKDQVLAIVPAYRTAAPGDVVVATWKNLANGSSAQLRTAPLTHLNYTDPVVVTFTGDFIRSMGDGQRQVTYRVEDRAGNPSVESLSVDLLVAAIRPPRYLPNPWLVEIGDFPSESGVLDPEKTLRGATARIPDDAVYYKEDRLEVQFGVPGETGSITVPVVAGAKTVLIPKECIAAYLDSTLPVTYLVHLEDGPPLPSRPLSLKISAFSPARLPGAQLAAPHSDPVYKSGITAAGLPVFQRTWAYISNHCLITITVSGTGTDNQPKTLTIVNAQPVTDEQVTKGVSAAVAQAFMFGLKNDVRFRVQTQVSFNQGRSWFPFTLLSPMLRN